MCPHYLALIVIDFIGRFENFSLDLFKIKKKMGVKKSKNYFEKKARVKMNYKEFYDEDLIDLVSINYKKDIDDLNYTFENDKLYKQSLMKNVFQKTWAACRCEISHQFAKIVFEDM